MNADAPDPDNELTLLRQQLQQREEELAEARYEANLSHTYVETILASMVDALLVLDNEGKIQTVNRATLTITGFSPEEILGHPLGFVLVEKEPDEFVQKMLYEGSISDYEGIFRVKGGGDQVPVYLSGALMVNDDDEIIGVVCVGKDISDLKRSQNQLIESEKMASIGKLVAGVAHEINTPVGVGVTAASTLRTMTREIQTAFDERAMTKTQLTEYLHDVEHTSDLLLSNLSRTGDLIASFKMVSADQISEVKRRFDLRDYIRDILTSLGPRLKGSPHAIQVTCPDDLEVESYPGVVGQVLTNLITNALMHAYAPDTAGTIAIQASREGGEVVIRFSDDGRGISPEHQQHIFEPFYTTARESGGTGLGLNILRNIVHQKLKGSVTCDSALGRGTTFTIRFPIRPPE
ncbi:MAG: PAS domain S-box protein [Magnetococcales bacterium]|nr:PAS domain S-box protein [Magnetococcales bacterium]